jgi:hypothetical protein
MPVRIFAQRFEPGDHARRFMLQLTRWTRLIQFVRQGILWSGWAYVRRHHLLKGCRMKLA